jgi:hypothetical protein
MNDPATKEDLEAAKKLLAYKIDQLGESFDNLREQNHTDHGALASLMSWLANAWRRFSILPAPPDDLPQKPGKTTPKDDTQ